ncbi:molybdate ABC transporter substrate-binding protein [Bacillus nitroreducens]
MYRFFLLLIMILFINGCSSPETNEDTKGIELTVSAATSMQHVLLEMKNMFEKEHPTIDIAFNFGASGALSQQISQGAPVDIFLSASEEKFQAVVKEGLIYEEYQKNVIGNELVLIVPKDNPNKITSVEDVKKEVVRLSIGIPESVPAGMYAKESLMNMGLWNDIENKLVFAKDVRQVLTYVKTGNVDAGFVYKTDTLNSDKIHIVTSVEPIHHSEIIYPIGIVKTSKHLEEAKLFYEFLLSKKALALFEEYGFTRLQ